MEIHLLFVLLCLLNIGYGRPDKCGPANQCDCMPIRPNNTHLKMDCSNKNLTSLCDVCHSNSSVLRNVTYLDASDNGISTIDAKDCMRGCEELRRLDLHNNTIAHINDTAFDGLNHLTFLDLSFNNLSIYNKGAGKMFKDMTNVETLLINGSFVNQIGHNQSYPDLTSLTSLKNLSMDGLRGSMFDHSYANLSNLAGLFLSGHFGTCDLGELNNDFFSNLHQLRTLDLSFCNISNVENNTFAIEHLEWLDLSHNQQLGFETLYNVSYSLQNTSIKFLNYSYVYNTFRTGTVLGLKQMCYLYNTPIEELAIDSNNIEMLEDNVVLLLPPNLKIFHTNNNMFRLGPYVFQLVCMDNLTEVYISFRDVGRRNLSLYFEEPRYKPNKPKYFEECEFMKEDFLLNRSKMVKNCIYIGEKAPPVLSPAVPKSLKTLVMTNSALKYEIGQLNVLGQNSIEYMDFSDNTLFSWKGPLRNFENLRSLNLANNYCMHLSKVFLRTFTSLEYLQASGNLIGFSLENISYTGPFQGLDNLKVLNLSLNRIYTINESAFDGLRNLESVDLSFNNIQEWTLDVITLMNLTHVNLSHNSLQMLPTYLTEHLSDVSNRRGLPFSVDLRHNYLRLSCDSLHFLKWMSTHRHNFIGFDEYTFRDDKGHVAQIVNMDSQINDLEKKCSSNVVWVVLSSIGVSICISIIVGGLIYKNRWKLRYFMYMSKQRFYGYVRIPNEDPLENFRYNAFISYADENLRFVKDEVIPRLEDGDNGITLCVHQRDFLPGNTIAENIVNAIQGSRKTVVLLTRAFLKRRWCMYEFNIARMETIYKRDGRSWIVIVMLEQIPAKDMPLELLELIKTESYIAYDFDAEEGQDLFWNTLRDAILA